MENSDFEVTLGNDSNGSVYKINITPDQQVKDNSPLHLEIKTLHHHCLILEESLENLEQTSGISSFPLIIGAKLKMSSTKPDTTTLQNNTIDMSSMISTNLSRSVNICGVGMAYQVGQA